MLTREAGRGTEVELKLEPESELAVETDVETETVLDETEPLPPDPHSELELELEVEVEVELAAVTVGTVSETSGGACALVLDGAEFSSSSTPRRSRSARRTCSSNPSFRLASHARAKSGSLLLLLLQLLLLLVSAVRCDLPTVTILTSSSGSVAGAARRLVPRSTLRFSYAFNARL